MMLRSRGCPSFSTAVGHPGANLLAQEQRAGSLWLSRLLRTSLYSSSGTTKKLSFKKSSQKLWKGILGLRKFTTCDQQYPLSSWSMEIHPRDAPFQL